MNSHGVHSPKFPVAGNFLAKDLIVFAKWQQTFYGCCCLANTKKNVCMDRTRKGNGKASGVDSAICYREEKFLFWKFVAGLNKVLNPWSCLGLIISRRMIPWLILG